MSGLNEAGGRPVFDPETFVSECQAARTTADPVGAVRKVIGTAIADGAAIDAALGAALTGEEEALFSSADLTVQRILWPGGVLTPPHEHRMWAVIGVYRGEELNRFYERTPHGLEECGAHAVGQGEVLVLDSDTIHSVENPHHQLTAGLHVYGGDIRGIDRSAWGPDGREVSWNENSSAYRSMFQPMRDLAQEHGTRIDDNARYDAFLALRAACEREGRYPTYAEARRIIADVCGFAA
jgi:predicted metal-dependent enzyme (double-stranded beta helix superfamily)